MRSDYNCSDNYATCLFLQKLYGVDKMALRALGLSLQQLPWLPFGASGPAELSWHHVKHHWLLSVSPQPLMELMVLRADPWKGIPRLGSVAEEHTGRGVQVWLHEHREGQEGEPRVCIHVRDWKGFTSLHFQLLVFYLGKIPFDSPGSELLIPVSGSFFTSIPQRTDFNAWWIQTKLFLFL